MNLEDIYALEGEAESLEDYALSMQRAINSGMVWGLQGTYGRNAVEAIKDGLCMLGDVSHKDHYGNTIPSRHLVGDYPGSRAFVVEQRGEEWAARLEEA